MTSCLINKNTQNAYTNKTTTLPRVVELIKKIKDYFFYSSEYGDEGGVGLLLVLIVGWFWWIGFGCLASVFALSNKSVNKRSAGWRPPKPNANAKATLDTLLKLGVVPIINENDTVVTDEIKFGDNDTLGALVTNLIEADALIILTDQGGLFSADPRSDANAHLIQEAQAGDPALEKMAGGAGSDGQRGAGRQWRER